MHRFPHHRLRLQGAWVVFALFITPLVANIASADSLTISLGKPYRHGRLINGIPFPTDFRGYHLRNTEKAYTTPEVIGTLLDAIEAVTNEYPDSCEVFLGDFSKKGGGWLRHHRSHQNGRDVDIGMYAKGNRNLNHFIPMNRANLDVPKTWCLIENLLRSQKIQYIFLDRRVQKLLYKYALSRGNDRTYLNQLFGRAGGAVIRHIRGHRDHMHVRFFTPWSTLAGKLRKDNDPKKKKVIELAQQAFLPKKVHYYVKGGESDLNALAKSFGVDVADLRRWNGLTGNDVLSPGSRLVFYKRGFELEPVHLAQMLRPSLTFASSPVQLASLSDKLYKDLTLGVKSTKKRKRSSKVITYKIRKGDTLGSIARKHGTTVKNLCRLNGIKKSTILRIGQKLKVGKGSSRKKTTRSKTKKTNKTRIYKVKAGDTLWDIARRTNTKVKTLCRINGISKKTILHAGQKIKLPSSTSRSSASSKKRTRKYTVRRGDNLWSIAKRYNTTTQKLCRANGLSSKTILRPGMRIKIP